MTESEKNEWLNKHLPYRYLMLIGYLIEHKAKNNNGHHINICLIESSYTALRGFLYFLLADALIGKGKPSRKATDVTIDKLGGRKIEILSEDEHFLVNQAIETSHKHVAHFTLEMKESASNSLGESVKFTIELLGRAMSGVEGFEDSELQKTIAKHKSLPF